MVYRRTKHSGCVIDRPVTIPEPKRSGPLGGMTILLVEDSKVASDAFRLMCLHSGARLRRAGTMVCAFRHLACYGPNVAIVDLGLPDGAGESLIRQIRQRHPKTVTLGLSGDRDGRSRALQAGAQGFIEKPVTSVLSFQRLVLAAFPRRRQRPKPRHTLPKVITDPLTYREDLEWAANLLKNSRNIGYVAQFLGGVARSAQDDKLESIARDLMSSWIAGANVQNDIDLLTEIMQTRLARGNGF